MPPALVAFRKAIRDAWLKHVGRRKFTSHEYRLTDQWFNAGIDVVLVVRAIERCADRANANNNTIYSLGVISADLEAIQKESARSHFGEHRADNWRERWKGQLEGLAKMAPTAQEAEEYRELITQLDQLSPEEAQQRFRAIHQRYYN